MTIQGERHHSIDITQNRERPVWGRMDGAQMGLDINTLAVDGYDKVILDDGRHRLLV
jgi:hypothetical protein